MKWFRFHADWIDNPKVRKLDATLQQRYILLLCMRCREEVPGISVEDMAWHFRCSEDECRDTLQKLQDAGLWTGDDVANWDERQYISDCSTERSRKHRSKSLQQRGCNVAETLPKRRATVTQRPQTQMQTSDPDFKKTPPTPRKRGRVVAAELKEDVAKIVDHLNAVTGKRHGAEKATGEIERCLNAGATVAECCEVIDHCWAQWKDNPKMVKFVNKVTPFRAIHFDAYLDEARAGRPKPKPAPKPVEDDDPDMTPAEREAARQALERLGVGGLCNWT